MKWEEMKTSRGLKIVHTADLHLGVGLSNISLGNEEIERKRILDFINQLRKIRDFAVKEKCDFFIIAGDVFHHRRPSGFVLDEFSKIVGSMLKEDIVVLVVAGNHDQPVSKDVRPYIKALHDIGPKNFFYIDKPTVKSIKGFRSGKTVCFICLPYLHPTLFDPKSYEDAIKNIYTKLHGKVEGEHDYLVVVGHFLTRGAKLSKGAKMIIPVDDIPISERSISSDDVSYVALGHVHKAQEVAKRIIYSGSVERINFGEEEDEKFFVFIEESGGDLEYTFEKLKCRPMLTIPSLRIGVKGKSINLTKAEDPTGALLDVLERVKILEGAIVRLICTLRSDQTIDIERLDEFFSSKNVLHWFLRNEPVDVDRPIIDPVIGKKLEEIFEEYVRRMFEEKVSQDILDVVLKEGARILRRSLEEV